MMQLTEQQKDVLISKSLQAKEVQRQANTRYRNKNQDKMRTHVLNHYNRNIDSTTFKTSNREKSKRYYEKKKLRLLQEKLENIENQEIDSETTMELTPI